MCERRGRIRRHLRGILQGVSADLTGVKGCGAAREQPEGEIIATPLRTQARRLIVSLHRRGGIARFGTQYALDVASWALALVIAEILRYELDATRISWAPLAVLILAAAILQCVFGVAFAIYRGRHPYGSFAEVQALLWTTLGTALVIGLPVVLWGRALGIPRSTVLIALPVAFLLMALARYMKRLTLERSMRPGDEAERTLVYGAGYLGSIAIRQMRTDPRSPYKAVGIVDDDPTKRTAWLHGVRVLGNGSDLGGVAEAAGATTLLVAIAHADAALLQRITDDAASVGLRVLVFPGLDEVLAGRTRLLDLRDISIEDLIGRHPVDTDVASVASYLEGRRVLVTGAGGSIGSELCRQIASFRPAELIMLDRDETGLQSSQIAIAGHGLLDTRDVVLGDIRDPEALLGIFRDRRPEVVFHAAALKHLPMLEQYPDEAWKTNVLGTLNVLRAAEAAGVETFVNISTDKAANPTSALGHSKRLAERLTAAQAERTGMRYLSVRFGNVIGSRGSMLPTFTRLIEAGGPLTVTHPDVTRYFMTIPEACQLVIQAGAIGRQAEVLILDMGEPVRILDVAERMIAMSGKPVEIVFTGLRPHEKLHEDLIGEGETDERPIHPKISHALIPALDPADLDKHLWDRLWDGTREEVGTR